MANTKVQIRSAREVDALCATMLMGWVCKSESNDGQKYMHRWYQPGQDFSPAETCVTTMDASGRYIGNHIARVIPRFSRDLSDAYKAWEQAVRGAKDPRQFLISFTLAPLTDEEKEAIQKAEEALAAGKKKGTKPSVVRTVLMTVTSLDSKGEVAWSVTDKPAMALCLGALRAVGLEVSTEQSVKSDDRISATLAR